ncbi:LuxR family transcriptional regulator [Allokutzneria multivorans]|uniref:LuxR family transcriptional regulator n=1 Tax=Allokutzneria multivorans TaxID=1142134 RepID=A0ABP7QWL8_9PSEU
MRSDGVVDAGAVEGGRPRFVGREAELEQMSEALAKVVSGVPQTVWVVGAAGIGKTTFVQRALSALDVPEFTVLDATGDPGESVLEFGLVDQIACRVDPVLLRSVPLLSGAAPGTSPFAVGAQLLEVLSVLQADRPVAVVVDDVHWADPGSARALGFLLRRMRADQILTVLIRRGRAGYDPESALHQLERSCPNATTIELSGLSGPDVGALSLAMRGEELAEATAERLRAHTGGNPLHIRTLLHELPGDALDDDRLALPAPSSLLTAVRATLERLPGQTRALLEALAVLDEVSPLARVAHVAGIADATLAVAAGLESGLLSHASREPSRPLRISHGLQREAIYDLIPPRRRVDLHERAAAVSDPISRWAHRVAAAAATDPGLARELEAAAHSAGNLGQHMLAARYLRWAADLSSERADHERRLLTCCVHMVFGSERSSALALRPQAERCSVSPLRSLALGLIALFSEGDRAAATRMLTDALQRCGEHDGWARAVSAAGLSGAHMWSGAAHAAIEPGRLALRLGGLPVRLADFVRVFIAVARCRVDGMDSGLAEFADMPADAAEVPPEQLDSLICRGAIRTMLGRFSEAGTDLRTAVLRGRGGVYTMSGASPHSYLAAIGYVQGEWEDASILADQSLSLADPDEHPHNRALRHMVASFVPSGRGDWSTATDHVRTAWANAQLLGNPQDLRYAVIAEATLHQAKGRHTEMLATLRALRHDESTHRNGTHTWWELWWRPLLVEALIATGLRAEAAEQLAVLRGRAAGVDYLAPTIVRLDLALAGGAGPGWVGDRVDELARRGPRRCFLQAQLESDFGKGLAETGQLRRAVPYLTSARDRFAELGAAPFEQRAIALIDKHAPSLSPAVAGLAEAPVPGLSRREGQVAHLVKLNLTNREIAAQLYVTTKTVEYHLANVFLKLGVANRRELRERLAAAPPAPRASAESLPR